MVRSGNKRAESKRSEATHALDAVSPVPLYSQIREALRRSILDGTYPPHSQMPSESQMIARFGVSRITIRQALGDLQKEGLIFKVMGKGSFVAKPKAFQSLSRLQGFGEAMAPSGYETYAMLLSAREVPASAVVAQRLALAEGSPVFEIQRLRYLNREPISVDVSYFPIDIGQRLTQEDLATRDIFVILENDYGHNLTHADVQIEAISAEESLGRHLDVAEGSPLLRIERLTYAGERPIDFEFLYYRGDAFQYRLRIDRS
ncbi:GntR family transcriptional regulator [Denitromonas iodatirespirans]|uniref:GntR family transcriptional regulator n=1 Tax=Denitromonas iodatirespirans TaxID=2795389 RepID=A0A944D932_DENI1|nr:GntR family transcriptional regulator [Denitromonas iodatirespirans]MBT0962219.1 GntR family transcriptional regulator [Denitromonas iodatirespirans]